MKLPKGKLKQALCCVKLNRDRIYDHIQFALPKTCFNLAETRILRLLGYKGKFSIMRVSNDRNKAFTDIVSLA